MSVISDRGKGLVADEGHHLFKIIAHLFGKAKSLHYGRGSQERQHANIVYRKLAIDCLRALDQAVELFKVRGQLAQIFARLSASFDKVACASVRMSAVS